ncbi:MAG: Mu transposase C-terminal domain-containing protein [Candidatus Cloacimonetes bacterium]|nr:Mu transposase C-terminal domain-containing protein [Candidatus Cloacimonadota bacterium]
MMATYDDILNNIDKEAYNREADKIMALVRAGHKITIVKPTAGTPKSIQSDKKLIKTANRMVSNLPEPIIESSSIPEPDIPAPLYKEVDADINLEPEAKELLSCMAEAQLYAQFCETVLERLEDSEARLETWNLIAEEYNSGKLVPELFKMRGKRTERSLRKWIDLYLETNRNMFSLIHKSRSQNKGRKVTYLEQHFLLKLLLTPQKVKIYTAVTTIKAYARMGALESPSSVPTLVRWCDDWVSNNKAVWTQARLGSKAVAEDIVKTIHRDNSLLNVGDVWVADGHTLAFDIINPKTGKAQRMTMIMVMDWASRYPVGASLAFTEDSQHIQLAFRNGFLNWGALPKYVYLDNGKAFRSKLFNEKWQEHDLSSDLAGIFPRLGIQVAFAESYNAKAKIIERFFKTFQEQFERFIGTFRGASIADKPATLMRNEKWARKMYEATPPTIEEAMQMIGFYVRYIYGENPHGGLNGRKPYEVFSKAMLPEDRKVETNRLNYLMMSAVRKTLRNNGIMLNKLQYWDTALMEHIGKEVVIRYDLADLRWIAVYDLQDNFLCQAEVRKAQDPFIHLSMDNPISHAEYQKEYKAIKRHQRQIATRTKMVVKNSQEIVHRLLRPLPALESNPTFKQAPILTQPTRESEELMQQLEQQVIKQIPIQEEEPKQTDIPTLIDGEIKPKQKSFDEMLKFIGIK